MYDNRQWGFIADMNYSGAITISDIWLWFKWLYFWPGDHIVNMLVESTHIKPIISFFEITITYDNYGGLFSGIVSFFIWCILLNLENIADHFFQR